MKDRKNRRFQEAIHVHYVYVVYAPAFFHSLVMEVDFSVLA